jgi:hypothetical protein
MQSVAAASAFTASLSTISTMATPSLSLLLKFSAVAAVATAGGLLLNEVAPLPEVGAVLSQATDLTAASVAARMIMWDAFEQFRKSAEFKRSGNHWVEIQLASPPHRTTSYTITELNRGQVKMTIKGGGLGGRVFEFKYGIGRHANLAQGLFLFRLDYMYYGDESNPIAIPIFKPHYHLHYDHIVYDHMFL